jgi:hypothetical protein
MGLLQQQTRKLQFIECVRAFKIRKNRREFFARICFEGQSDHGEIFA